MLFRSFSRHQSYRRRFFQRTLFVVVLGAIIGGVYFASTYMSRRPAYLTFEEPGVEAGLVVDAHMRALADRDWQSFFSGYAQDTSIIVREGENERTYEGLSEARTLWMGESSRSRDVLSSRIRDVETVIEAQEGDSFTVLLKLRRPLSGIKEWRAVVVVREGRVVQERLEAIPEVVTIPSGEPSSPVNPPVS